MKNISGLLIKINRENKGLKQEYICKGICAVSYLSKIEKGLITPGEEILRKLFERLEITYYNDSDFVKQGKVLFDEIYKAYYSGIPVGKGRMEELERNKERYLNSPLFLDYHLYERKERLCKSHKIDILKFKEYMDQEQLFKAYYFTGIANEDMDMLTEAKKIKYAPEIMYGMGHTKWMEGKYYEAIELFLDSLNLAYGEGYIKLQMDICLILGHIYMDFHLPTMQKYYDKAFLLSKLVNCESMEHLVYYHTGIAYTARNYAKAEENLLKAVTSCPAEDSDSLEKTYQKLCFLYLSYGLKEQAYDFYDKAVRINQLESVNALIEIMVKTEDFIHNKDYINQLAAIYNQSKKLNKFSNTKYYGDFLIEAYKANRKYKEVLSVSEYIYASLTQEF